MKRNKLLFLPACLEKAISEEAIALGFEKNYDVYLVPGGSKVKKIIENYDFKKLEKIIGVACGDEIKLMEEYAKSKYLNKSKIYSIELKKEGCSETFFNLDDLLNIL